MGRRRKRKPYRIIGAYDSETTNIIGKDGLFAFPILHQLGIIDKPIEQIDKDNVEDATVITLYRHCIDLYRALDAIAESTYDYVPVICCHNLSFDMYGLSAYLDGCDNVRVLAKSCRKPITFTICDDENNPRLVLWDTLVFSGQSLQRMGEDCGYAKATGEWDYNLIRTPETPLTDDEIDYAKRDVYALLAWLGWWIRRNPDIRPDKLGLNVVTKTGVVRERRRVRFDQVKGKRLKYNIGRYWHYLNQQQAPKDDDELDFMMAATRGGFTFCASEHASKVYDLVGTTQHVYGFDSTSMHPAQMVSHVYPVRFHKTTPKALDNAFSLIERTNIGALMRHWDKPFMTAFYALFEFGNIRPKRNTLYAKHGILPLASARFKRIRYELNEDNQDFQEYKEQNNHDDAVNPRYLFGKLVSADKVRVYVTELGAWEIAQAYDYDYAKPIKGYMTNRYVKPSDMSVVSVMQFYKAKNAFKHARNEYYREGHITDASANDLLSVQVPESIVEGMRDGTISDSDVDATYMSLKADLNALYGIECSNEYRRNTVLTSEGIVYEGEHGICNAPKNPKAWYQFGQRIVGWSRIAQHIIMQLCSRYAIAYVNGDTDSIKILMNDADYEDACAKMDIFSRALERAKHRVCKRVKRQYPAFYDDLAGIGAYVMEFKADRFCASWNKAYAMHEIDKRDGKRHFAFTLAGIPARRGLNDLADRLYEQGYTFADICNIVLGYNATIAYDLLGLHGRSFPEWASTIYRNVTDYNGVVSRVSECAALALHPMAKAINSTGNRENYENCLQAVKNNPDINVEDLIIHDMGFKKLGDMYD